MFVRVYKTEWRILPVDNLYILKLVDFVPQNGVSESFTPVVVLNVLGRNLAFWVDMIKSGNKSLKVHCTNITKNIFSHH